MNLANIISKLSLHPERFFTKDTEEGKLSIFANKKGEMIQELILTDGSKRRVALKLSVHDNEDWTEVIPEITWEEAIRGYLFNNRGFKLVGDDGRVIFQRPDENLGGVVIYEGDDYDWDTGFTKEEMLNYKFYPHYEFEETPADVKASWDREDIETDDILED